MTSWLRRFSGDRRGNVAMIAALCALPLALIVGVSVDLTRQRAARQDAQDSIDQAALAAAISRSRSEEDLKGTVETYLRANMSRRYIGDDYDVDVDYDAELHHIRVSVEGRMDAFFAGLIDRQSLPIKVNVTAVRGAADAVELVLVLDNTDSMNQVDSGGQTRIAALKAAATELVNTVKENEIADVKVGIVPYGEYVNVGKANKGATWLSLAEYDQTVPAKDNGVYPDTETVCTQYGPYYTVTKTRQRDGYVETYTETKRDCLKSETRPHPKAGQPKPQTPASTVAWRWEGCVYSRVGAMRLTDANPTTPYLGLIEKDGQPDCMTEVLPLTQTRSTVLSAITGMRTTVSGKIPQTYIPSGLIWGINVLSPTAPFTEGRDYASGNRSPRKIMVLMTDGENTMRYREDAKKTYGYHEVTSAAGQIKQTNDDVTALCDYARSKQIEVYTVALGVGGTAQTMLQGCATQPSFFFNAENNAALGDAFREIAASINKVRLIR